MRLSPGGTSFTFTSSYRTSPESGGISPAIIFRRVVLPHPLGPRMTRVLPSGIRRFRFWMENAAVVTAPDPALSRSLSVLPTLLRSIRAMTLLQLRSLPGVKSQGPYLVMGHRDPSAGFSDGQGPVGCFRISEIRTGSQN